MRRVALNNSGSASPRVPGTRRARRLPNASALLTEASELLGELESLIRRINRTNAATEVERGTLTDALARRDLLRMRPGVVTSAANAVAGDGQRGFRQLRSELEMIPALPVAELRGEADDLTRQLREVTLLQRRDNAEPPAADNRLSVGDLDLGQQVELVAHSWVADA